MNILLFFLVQLSDGILNTEVTPFPDPINSISLYLSISLIDISFFMILIFLEKNLYVVPL